MSIEVMTRVWANSKQKGSALLLMISIADYANEKGVAYPSIETLAKKVRMSERNVQILLRKLQEAGEIDIKPNAGPAGCNLYRIKLDSEATVKGGENFAPPQGENIAPGGEEAFTEGVKRVSPGGEIQRAGGVKRVSPDPSVDPPIEPSENATRARPPAPAKPAAAAAPSSADYQAVVKAYHAEIGLLTPIIEEEIKTELRTSSLDWVLRAIAIAAMRNNRRWAYIAGILRRWHTEGFDGGMDNLTAHRAGSAQPPSRTPSKSRGYGRTMQPTVSAKGQSMEDFADDPEYYQQLQALYAGSTARAAAD